MTAPNPDFSDRLDFTVDPEAEPVDIDDAVATFLIAYANGLEITPGRHDGEGRAQ